MDLYLHGLAYYGPKFYILIYLTLDILNDIEQLVIMCQCCLTSVLLFQLTVHIFTVILRVFVACQELVGHVQHLLSGLCNKNHKIKTKIMPHRNNAPCAL